MEFNTISVSDGVTMGTEGMKASLISREVIADSIELVVRGHLLDGVVCLVGCDKTMPGRGDGDGPPRRPRLALYNGTIYPGMYKGQDRRRRDASTRRSARTGPARSASTSCTRSRTPRVPGAGACGGQYTANTMSMVLEFLGPVAGAASTASRPRTRRRTTRPGAAASSSWTSSGATSGRPRSSRGPRSTTRSRRSPRPAARRTASSTCSRSPTSSGSRSTSTSSARSPTGPRSSPT